MVASNLAKNKMNSNNEISRNMHIPIRVPIQNRENYFHCPCAINVKDSKTGHPLTSHTTKKFQQAVKSRSEYDQYWLKVYNKHSEKMNYNLV